MKLAEAALAVLEQSSEPLHSKEIIERALEMKLIEPRGSTPDHSLQAVIWKHINKQGNPHGFVMIGTGRQNRKYWLKSKNKGVKQKQ